MTRTQHDTKEQARSRGTEGSIILVVVLSGLLAAVAFVGSQIAHLFGGIGHALP